MGSMFFIPIVSIAIASLIFMLAVVIFLGCSKREKLFGFRKIISNGKKVIVIPCWFRWICFVPLILTIIAVIVAR